VKRTVGKNINGNGSHFDHRCNHPLAVVIDPTDLELNALETMLAQCPNCSRWMPGDGPIMAVLLSGDHTRHEPKEIKTPDSDRTKISGSL